MATNKKAKTILIQNGELQKALLDRTDDRNTFNSLGNLLLERYFALVRSRVRVIRKTFTEPELQAFLDAANGTDWNPIEVGIQTVALELSDAFEDGLADKWNIDGAAMLAKIEAVDNLTIVALIDFAEYAWRNAGRLKFGEPYLILADVAGDRR